MLRQQAAQNQTITASCNSSVHQYVTNSAAGSHLSPTTEPSTSHKDLIYTAKHSVTDQDWGISDVNNQSFGSFIDHLLSVESVATTNSIQTQPTPILVNHDIPLGNNIPLRIKENIWNDEIIYFRLLLPNSKETNT